MNLNKSERNYNETSIPQYKNFVMNKAGVMNSGEQFSANQSIIDKSNQTAKFSLLKDSDLAECGSINDNDPIVPTVTPLLKPLVPSLGGRTEECIKSVENSKFLKLQELEGNKVSTEVFNSTDLTNTQHNYYCRYSQVMEKEGLLGNKWYIPVQKMGEKYITPEGYELELHKSYTIPFKKSKGIDGKNISGLIVYCTLGKATNEIEGTSTENKGLLRVHVNGTYVRIELCKFLFNCITPIEYLEF